MKTIPRLAVFFAAVHILLHLCTADNLGFHRDEFLYLTLGRHLDWGYWSNGPLIGIISWVSQALFGGSLLATRVFPALAGGAVLLLSGMMIRDLGGNRFAQLLNGVAMLGSVAWLRAFGLFQPVCFDILFWTLLSFFLLKWLKTNEPRWWWAIGLTAGLGFLNKYTLVFWAAGLLLALSLTRQRRVLLSRPLWLAVGLALTLALPNLAWQWHYNFPVAGHMRELAESQLSHVQPLNFLLDQLLMHGPGGALVWVAGLVFLLRSKAMQPYRLLGWHYVAVMAIFLALNGKSYYTLGLYPALFAAGVVYWEQVLQKTASRVVAVAVVAALAVPLIPTGVPLWPAGRLVSYFRWLTYDAGIDAAVRWEDGELHELPQDYADMLGWTQLAALADTALARAGDPRNCLIYGENYGQAGAIEHLSKRRKTAVVSFSDSYRLWVPEQLPPEVNTLIYVNDELGEDVANGFADIQKIGEITDPLAREHGTAVWLCRQPKGELRVFWAERVREVKRYFGLP